MNTTTTTEHVEPKFLADIRLVAPHLRLLSLHKDHTYFAIFADGTETKSPVGWLRFSGRRMGHTQNRWRVTGDLVKNGQLNYFDRKDPVEAIKQALPFLRHYNRVEQERAFTESAIPRFGRYVSNHDFHVSAAVFVGLLNSDPDAADAICETGKRVSDAIETRAANEAVADMWNDFDNRLAAKEQQA